VSHIISIAVPYLPPADSFVPLKLMTQAYPTLGYQNQMASGIVEQRLKTKDEIKSFFNGFYGGTTPAGLPGFSLNSGLNFTLLPSLRKTPLLSAQVRSPSVEFLDTDICQDLDYYATEYARHGLKGPCRSMQKLDVV
jgi:soluble epoxide hydrolase/lipid-phosphate phosphatase